MASENVQKLTVDASLKKPLPEIPEAETEKPKKRKGKLLSEVQGKPIEFIWNPYIPKDEITIIFADSGMGKNQIVCGILSHFADGHIPLNFDLDEPLKTVFFSGEDKAESDFYTRLSRTEHKENILLFDKTDSVGFSFEDQEHASEMVQEAQDFGAKIMVIDPIQSFIGTSVDMSRMNQIRPRMQSLARMAEDIHGSVILISHINKRTQGENANHAVMGSADIVASARSAIQIVYDDRDPSIKNRRLFVHTKSNGAPLGQTILFEITDKGVNFLRYEPDITNETLTASARSKKTIGEYLEYKEKNFQKTDIESSRLNRVYDTILDLAMNQAERKSTYNIRQIEAYSMSRFGDNGELFPNGRLKYDVKLLYSRWAERGYNVTPVEKLRIGQRNENGNEVRLCGIRIEKLQNMTQKPDPSLLDEN